MHNQSDMTQSLSPSDKLARGLGWLSLGVGLYQLLAPGKITQQLGMEGSENGMRACGVRGIMSGIGALSDNPTPAIWSRLGGDVIDLAVLTYALNDERNTKKENVYLALTAVGILTAIDCACAKALSKRHAYQGGVTPDYSHRSGFPQGLDSARGAALDFDVPADMKDALPSPTL
ncbi:hypothetical protein QT231_03785 [Halomonas sp. SpR1]|uniref:hypothetical protein n=1 Tax=Halomonas sp. SpR1 TaxID=3050462 RepID=UPI0027E4A412|nr:hypothetical protein [Halomonas sp. SpR1]MDQ7731804.1 hypothetical protein [Halomonas sp. SpR1]